MAEPEDSQSGIVLDIEAKAAFDSNAPLPVQDGSLQGVIATTAGVYQHIVLAERHGIRQAELYKDPALYEGMKAGGIGHLFWETSPQSIQPIIDRYMEGGLDRDLYMRVTVPNYQAADLYAEEFGGSEAEEEYLDQTINDVLHGYAVDMMDEARARDIRLVGLDPSVPEVYNFIYTGQVSAARGKVYEILMDRAREQGYNRAGQIVNDAREEHPYIRDNYETPNDLVTDQGIRDLLFSEEENAQIDDIINQAYLDTSTERDQEFWKPVIDASLDEGEGSILIVGAAHSSHNNEIGIDELLGGDAQVATFLVAKDRSEFDSMYERALEDGDMPHGSIIIDEAVFIPTEKFAVEGYAAGQVVALADITDLPNTQIAPMPEETLEESVESSGMPAIPFQPR